VGLILALSSTAIVLSTLEERGTAPRPGRADSFSVLLLQDPGGHSAVRPCFPCWRRPGPRRPETAGLFGDQPPWLQAVATLAAVAVVLAAGKYLARPLFRFIAKSQLREIFTAATLLIVVGVPR
jgi:Kef-type K+ transport system membrane component KefB